MKDILSSYDSNLFESVLFINVPVKCTDIGSLNTRNLFSNYHGFGIINMHFEIFFRWRQSQKKTLIQAYAGQFKHCLSSSVSMGEM